jgi:hypothetical protein
VIKNAPPARVVLARDIDAGLFVEPPRRQPQLLRDGSRLFQYDAVWDEHGIDVSRDATRVVDERHRGAAHDEQIGDDATPGQPFTQSGEGAPGQRDPSGSRRRLSCCLQIMRGQINAMLTERRRRPDQRVGTLDGELSGKPRPPQHPRLRPLRRCEVMLSAQMLSQRGEQSIPALVSHGWRLGLEEADLGISRLPAILLKELPYQLPPHLFLRGCRQVLAEPHQAHRLIT